MPVILKLGWSEYYLLPDEALMFLTAIRKVNEKTVGKVKKYFIEDDDFCPSIEVIQGKQVVREGTDEEAADFKKLYASKEKEASDYQTRAWKAETETAELKKKLETLKSICPETHQPAKTEVEEPL